MKFSEVSFSGLLLCTIYFVSLGGRANASDGYGSVWQRESEVLIAKVEGDPSDENIVRLCSMLRIAGYHGIDSHEKRASIDRVVNVLVAIPDVADRLAKDLNGRRENVVGPSDDYRFTYEPWRATLFMNVLPHLRTPETVMVLGEFLDDDRDLHPMQDAGRVHPPPESAYFALSGLIRMEISNPPFSGEVNPISLKHDPASRDALPKFQDWFDGVQSGRTKFSFVGGDEEYRLLPDESWEAVHVSGRSDGEGEQVKRPVPIHLSAEVERQIPQWWWIAGILLALGVGVCAFRRKLG